MKSFCLLFFLFTVITISAQNKVREGNFERGLSSWETRVVDGSDEQAEQPWASATFSAVEPGLNNSKSALFAGAKWKI